MTMNSAISCSFTRHHLTATLPEGDGSAILLIHPSSCRNSSPNVVWQTLCFGGAISRFLIKHGRSLDVGIIRNRFLFHVVQALNLFSYHLWPGSFAEYVLWSYSYDLCILTTWYRQFVQERMMRRSTVYASSYNI